MFYNSNQFPPQPTAIRRDKHDYTGLFPNTEANKNQERHDSDLNEPWSVSVSVLEGEYDLLHEFGAACHIQCLSVCAGLRTHEILKTDF